MTNYTINSQVLIEDIERLKKQEEALKSSLVDVQISIGATEAMLVYLASKGRVSKDPPPQCSTASCTPALQPATKTSEKSTPKSTDAKTTPAPKSEKSLKTALRDALPAKNSLNAEELAAKTGYPIVLVQHSLAAYRAGKRTAPGKTEVYRRPNTGEMSLRRVPPGKKALKKRKAAKKKIPLTSRSIPQVRKNPGASHNIVMAVAAYCRKHKYYSLEFMRLNNLDAKILTDKVLATNPDLSKGLDPKNIQSAVSGKLSAILSGHHGRYGDLRVGKARAGDGSRKRLYVAVDPNAKPL